jgi:transposase
MRCIRTRGKKSEPHLDPLDPPRRRANKQRGHGTYANDRPPIVGTVGRTSGSVRLRMVHHTDGKTLCQHVAQFTAPHTHLYTDEWQGYRRVKRRHSTVCHALNEWARDDDRDGIREVHINSIEGLWTRVRNFLRLFRGVHKKYLSGYLAICEFHINLKRISPDFIAALVACTCP